MRAHLFTFLMVAMSLASAIPLGFPSFAGTIKNPSIETLASPASSQDPAGGIVIATILVSARPRDVGYSSGTGYVYVASQQSNLVTVISGTTLVTTIPVGGDPWGVVYDDTDGYVYVTNYSSGTVSVIYGTKLLTNVVVGTNPNSVAYNSGNGAVYVANEGSGTVSVINETIVVATITVGTNPQDVAYDSENGYVYVTNLNCPSNACGVAGTVSVIRDTTVVGTVTVGITPQGVAYDSGNGYIYVANESSGTVSVIGGTTVFWTVTVGGGPSGVGYDSGNGEVYVTNFNSNDVSLILGTFVGTAIQVGSSPYSAGYDSGNGYVYVTNYGSNTISVISPAVMFTETGLPTGTTWTVVLNGVSSTSTTSTVTFSEPNGMYSYTVGSISGYTSSPSSGQIGMNGAFHTVAINFAAIANTVTFVEVGLPYGTAWAVSLNGNYATSTTSTVTFSEPNGMYSYTVGGISGYTDSPSSGSVTVNGAPVSVTIQWTNLYQTYLVTFVETGLPTGTAWTVGLNGESKTSTSSTVTFSEPNGMYTYTVGNVSGDYVWSESKSITVNGAPQTIEVYLMAPGGEAPAGQPSFVDLFFASPLRWLTVLPALVGIALALVMRARRRK